MLPRLHDGPGVREQTASQEASRVGSRRGVRVTGNDRTRLWDKKPGCGPRARFSCAVRFAGVISPSYFQPSNEATWPLPRRPLSSPYSVPVSLPANAAAALRTIEAALENARRALVTTEETALLQEAGVYRYAHPLTDAVSYAAELEELQEEIKEMNRAEGGAVLATKGWTVNGSEVEGRKMVRDFSKLMLRAFNAEADNLVRGLRPYKVKAAIDAFKRSQRPLSALAAPSGEGVPRRRPRCGATAGCVLRAGARQWDA
jgi:hypothetical protein